MKDLALIQMAPIAPDVEEAVVPRVARSGSALGKDFKDFRLCDRLALCRNFEELERDNPEVREGLAKIGNGGRETLVDQWQQELQRKWPHGLLFYESSQE